MSASKAAATGDWLYRVLSRVTARVDPARVRFWGVVLPIHLAAFGTLYYGTYRLLEYAYSHAAAAAARRQLDQAVRGMPFLMPQSGGRANPHLFAHVLAMHQPIGLHLYRRDGTGIAVADPASTHDEHGRVLRLLADPRREQDIWTEAENGRDWVRGAVRLTAGTACQPCHQAGATIGVATMKIDFTDELAGIHSLLRRRVGILLGLWVLLVGGVAAVVQVTVKRSLSTLEADLAAAAAGRSAGIAASDLPLDPAAAQLHARLRDFLKRQREREVEVASRLAHVDQLASLGQLAAGLAHEIKNPLAGIQGALEVLKDETPDESTVRLYEEMLDELKRVNGILQRLLDSGRPAPLRLVRTDLAKLLHETVELMRPGLHRRKVELASEVAAELPEIDIDAAKVRQVLVNLIQNAGEAMGEAGGHVTVRASALAGRVVIAVEDDGPGIAREDLSQVFEPFFTTKFAGTGLGLAISKGILEQHGGTIQIDSEPGRGTTFFLFLPLRETTPEAPVAEVA